MTHCQHQYMIITQWFGTRNSVFPTHDLIQRPDDLAAVGTG